MAPSRHKRIPGIKIIQENLHKAIPRFGSNARRQALPTDCAEHSPSACNSPSTCSRHGNTPAPGL